MTDEGQAPMLDRSCLELADLRHYLSSALRLYHEIMQEKSRGVELRMQAAARVEAGVGRYLMLLHETETVVELAQLQKILGQWRSNLPQPFED